MGFRLLSKSVTLNDLERRNGCIWHYFTEFCTFGLIIGPKCHSGGASYGLRGSSLQIWPEPPKTY